MFSACLDQARHHVSDVVSAPKKVRDTGSLGYPFLQQEHQDDWGAGKRLLLSGEMPSSVLPVAASTRASSTTSSPSCSAVNVWRTASFLESKGRYKRYAQDPIGVLGMIAEPTGTDEHRPIGRPWHVFPLKSFYPVEAICLSTRNTLPLPHPEMGFTRFSGDPI